MLILFLFLFILYSAVVTALYINVNFKVNDISKDFSDINAKHNWKCSEYYNLELKVKSLNTNLEQLSNIIGTRETTIANLDTNVDNLQKDVDKKNIELLERGEIILSIIGGIKDMQTNRVATLFDNNGYPVIKSFNVNAKTFKKLEVNNNIIAELKVIAITAETKSMIDVLRASLVETQNENKVNE